MSMMSVYFACIRAVGDVSSYLEKEPVSVHPNVGEWESGVYPAKFSASTTVTIASSFSSPFVSFSSSRIWNARVAGKAEPLRCTGVMNQR